MRIEDTDRNGEGTDERMSGAKGKRAWLTVNELSSLYRIYERRPQRQIALRLMGECGLRTAEVLDVRLDDVRRADTDGEHYKLRVRQGKGENGGKWRETIIPTGLRSKMLDHAGTDTPDDEPLINVTRRTLQRWMDEATDELLEETDDDGWQYVSCHDLRRSWAKKLLENEASAIAVMQLGGWENYQVFRDNYMTSLSDETLVREASKLTA